MKKAKFSSVDELREFIGNNGFDEVKFCVNPDYVDAVIGISDEGKVVYDHEKMVDHLARLYEQEENCEDPYTDALEWIGFNCDVPYWEIVTPVDDWWPGITTDIPNVSEYAIGVNQYGTLLVDSEKATENDIKTIMEFIDKDGVNLVVI